MGSSFLTLTNNVLVKLNEVVLDTSTFANARGIHSAAKNSVNYVINEINEEEFKWPFNAIQHAQALTKGVVEYGWPEDFKVADWDTFQIQKDTGLNVNSKTLKLINRQDWYDHYRDADTDAGVDGLDLPDYVFPTHGNGYGVTPSPNQAYNLTYRYFQFPDPLALHNDTTNIPSVYDQIILNGCLAYMYTFLDNDQRSQSAERKFRRGIDRMRSILINNDARMTNTVIRTGGYSFQRGVQ